MEKLFYAPLGLGEPTQAEGMEITGFITFILQNIHVTADLLGHTICTFGSMFF